MKNLSIFLLSCAFFTSCGMQLEDGNGRSENSIGEIRSYHPETFDAQSLIVLNEICNALAAKEGMYISTYVDQNRELNFTNSEKTCGQAEPSVSEVRLKLKNINGKVAFVTETGSSARFFSEFETKNQGIISKFCSKLYLGQPIAATEMLQGAAYADWYRVSNSQVTCGSQNTACFISERGFTMPNGRYEVKQYEKIVINTETSSLKRGVVTYRESLSSFSCVDKNTDFLSSTRRL